MHERVEGLRVGVVHGPGQRIRPVWFELRRRKHSILQITNVWHNRCGETKLIHFHVTDEGALYELIYNLSINSWSLESIEAL